MSALSSRASRVGFAGGSLGDELVQSGPYFVGFVYAACRHIGHSLAYGMDEGLFFTQVALDGFIGQKSLGTAGEACNLFQLLPGSGLV